MYSGHHGNVRYDTMGDPAASSLYQQGRFMHFERREAAAFGNLGSFCFVMCPFLPDLPCVT